MQLADAAPVEHGRPERARRGPSGRWSVALAVLVLVGLASAVVGATAWYSAVAGRARAAFRTSATSISMSLVTTVGRDADFVASQQALFGTFPSLTNRRYVEWFRGVGARSRYPGGLGFSYVERVPHADLAAFAATVARDPVANARTPSPADFTPYPAGSRAQYCLSRLGYYEGTSTQTNIATFDFCAPLGSLSPFPHALALSTDSGTSAIAPPVALYPGVFFIAAPVYRSGVVPTTLVARRADLVGLALGTFSGAETLQAALGNLAGFAVRLAYVPAGASPVQIGSAGRPSATNTLTRTAPAGANGDWRITIVGGSSSDAFSEALVVGLLVLGVTILVFLVLRLLTRSRERALLLVDERTGELRHQALHDSLTGLPNRALIVDRAEQMLARARREPLATGVLFIDLDNFKDINDSFGHQRGDQLLQAVAERLVTAVRPSDSVGRLGGDEFVVLVEGRSLDAGPDVVAERVLEVLAEPFTLEGLEGVSLAVRASIGVAVGARPGADELLRDADVALYQAKQTGKGRFVLFHPEMQLAVQDRLALEMDLRVAIARGQLFVEYQPTFDLRTLAMTGVEALARWQHPTRGLVAPDDFIPIAEESGLISAIGRFVLSEACGQAAAWNRQGRTVPLSVNVSGRQLESEDLPGVVRSALAEAGLDPSLLTLELTETVLMRDADSTSRRLRSLKELGVRIAVDDFGTGYSSLAYLRQFPVDALKIDRSFINGIARSTEARALIHTLVQLGKTLGLDTFAEGIEDEAQLAELQREQCDHGQGFYYSRPLPPGAVEALFLPSTSGAPTTVGEP